MDLISGNNWGAKTCAHFVSRISWCKHCDVTGFISARRKATSVSCCVDLKHYLAWVLLCQFLYLTPNFTCLPALVQTANRMLQVTVWCGGGGGRGN